LRATSLSRMPGIPMHLASHFRSFADSNAIYPFATFESRAQEVTYESLARMIRVMKNRDMFVNNTSCVSHRARECRANHAIVINCFREWILWVQRGSERRRRPWRHRATVEQPWGKHCIFYILFVTCKIKYLLPGCFVLFRWFKWELFIKIKNILLKFCEFAFKREIFLIPYNYNYFIEYLFKEKYKINTYNNNFGFK